MRLFQATSTIFIAFLLGILMMAVVAVEFPPAFNVILNWGTAIEEFIGSSDLNDKYNNWIRFFIGKDQIVLLGFVMVARIIISLITAGFNSVFGGSRY